MIGFIIGCFVGVFIGIAIMCVLQVSAASDGDWG